jgi:hypothetical protein
MKTNTTALDEIVVVGYGQQKKVNLTGAVATVDIARNLEGRPQLWTDTGACEHEAIHVRPKRDHIELRL